MGTVEIINGDHQVGPRGENLPFMVMPRDGGGSLGLHIDLTGVGQLWDHQTVRHIFWGIRDDRDRVCGRIELKNGEVRRFYDAVLMVPYVDAYNAALARHRSSEADAAAVHKAFIHDEAGG